MIHQQKLVYAKKLSNGIYNKNLKLGSYIVNEKNQLNYKHI